MRPWRPDDAKEFRRREQHLEIDVRPRFDGLVEKSDIMGEDAKLELVDEIALGRSYSRDSGGKYSGGERGAKHSHHFRCSRPAFTSITCGAIGSRFSASANPQAVGS